MMVFATKLARRSGIPILAAALACLCVSSGAQDRGVQDHVPGGPPGGQARGGFGAKRNVLPGNTTTRLPSPSTGAGGLQTEPPARWWDNKEFARTIGINPVQARRMDDVFTANRDNLMRLYKNLQHEESQLKKLTRSQTLDENQIFQQIDRVTMARGELEKANAHMELQIRKEMTTEQAAKLDDLNGSQPPQE
jgi:Spy/CpxP family protein refolding chaperone